MFLSRCCICSHLLFRSLHLSLQHIDSVWQQTLCTGLIDDILNGRYGYFEKKGSPKKKRAGRRGKTKDKAKKSIEDKAGKEKKNAADNESDAQATSVLSSETDQQTQEEAEGEAQRPFQQTETSTVLMEPSSS